MTGELTMEKLRAYEPWIGVDLDGTLAFYDGWKGAEHIGPPIPAMLNRIHRWIKSGRKVKIFTARAAVPEQVIHVYRWLEDNGLDGIEVTNTKDHACVAIWDDRAVRVVKNTGEPCPGCVKGEG